MAMIIMLFIISKTVLLSYLVFALSYDSMEAMIDGDYGSELTGEQRRRSRRNRRYRRKAKKSRR
jgi:hypothetical protein